MLYAVGTAIDLSHLNFNKERSSGAKKITSGFQEFFESQEKETTEVPIGTEYKFSSDNGILRFKRVIPISYA